MDTYLLAAPQGFGSTCSSANHLAKTNTTQLQDISRARAYAILHNQPPVSSSILLPSPSSSSSSSSVPTVDIGPMIDYLYYGIQRYNTVDPKTWALSLTKHTDLTTNAIEIIVTEYFNTKATSTSFATSVGSSGTVALDPVRINTPALVGMDWSLGITVGSSSTTLPSSLTSTTAAVSNTTSTINGHPFVTLHMKVQKQDGTTGIESMEMSLSQLKEFEASIREASEALDRA